MTAVLAKYGFKLHFIEKTKGRHVKRRKEKKNGQWPGITMRVDADCLYEKTNELGLYNHLFLHTLISRRIMLDNNLFALGVDILCNSMKHRP